MSISPDTPSKFAYPHNNGGRDLRIDFLRGFIMLVVITVHMEYFSLFSMFVWERLGLVSSAEGFVGLSGIVLGIVYKKRLLREGYKCIALKLWKRSFQLYRVNLFVILSIALLGAIPFIDVHVVTHWAPVADQKDSYLLYPPPSASWIEVVKQALLLKIGPHQFQVIGLYVGLIAVAPLVLYCVHRKKTLLLLAASWSAFGINQLLHLRITGARFEFAFPSLTWQLIFINTMVVGYHHEKVLGYIAKGKNRVLFIGAGLVCLAFLFLAMNNPNRIFWPWPPLSFIDATDFGAMYFAWFQKSDLGLGRIMNNIALFIVFYYALSHYWLPINKALGWLLIPLGQASLYVFILHVYFVLLVSNTSLPEYDNFFINTAIHATTILLIWAMVKRQVLFKVIPR
ncbi:MAG: OpgC domain-containing protein [Methylococcales bacterium]